MSVGLSFVLNIGPWVHHSIASPYLKSINLENGTIFLILNFTTTDAFVAQKSMDVDMQIVEKSTIDKHGVITPFPHPLSNNFRIGSYNVMIIDARNSDSSFPHTELNYTGAYISPSDYKEKPILRIQGNGKVIFPFAGDYTAYLLVSPYNHAEISIPLGKVMNVSPPEASLQVTSNNIGTGLSIIVVGLTIIQIGLALQTSKKYRSSE